MADFGLARAGGGLTGGARAGPWQQAAGGGASAGRLLGPVWVGSWNVPCSEPPREAGVVGLRSLPGLPAAATLALSEMSRGRAKGSSRR